MKMQLTAIKPLTLRGQRSRQDRYRLLPDAFVESRRLKRQDFVVGWTDPEGSRPHLGALLLGYHTDDARLVYSSTLNHRVYITCCNDACLRSFDGANRRQFGIEATNCLARWASHASTNTLRSLSISNYGLRHTMLYRR